MPSARSLNVIPGILPPGPLNDIGDVAGVMVGHCTLIEGDDIRTGVTAILPHGGNIFQDKVPAGLAVGNGFGKLTGSTQLIELGEIETPILLTNTLAVPRAAEALIEWTLAQPGNELVTSINPVVGETNDGWLNDIRKRAVTTAHCRQALEAARAGPVAQGCHGAGTGTVCFGWKGGIGSSSRRLPENLGGWTLGVLVQTNFGGVLQLPGHPLGIELGQYYLKDQLAPAPPGESIMIILASDAPLSARNLERLARRALGGLARTGASLQHGSGDYAIAFSTHLEVRRTLARCSQVYAYPELPHDGLSPLFQAAIEATEEAIYNSLFYAETTTGFQGHTARALWDVILSAAKDLDSSVAALPQNDIAKKGIRMKKETLMKIYISADIEGVTGATDWNETDKAHASFTEFSEQMTAEVAAACQGALAAGASEILVKDAHWTGRNLLAARLPRQARLVRGWMSDPYAMMAGLDESFDAALMIGYHSRAGSAGSPLAHTMSGRVVYVKINGLPVAEFTINSYTAAWLGVPVVFLSGDAALCQDASAFLPGLTTVAVKEGIGEATVNIHPELAVERIRDSVEQALKGDLGRCRVPLPAHFEVELRYKDHAPARQISFYPGAKLLEPHVVQFAAEDYFEVLRFFHFAF